MFTRGLKPASRPIPVDTPELLSPCDGTVQDAGRLNRDRLMTVKGVEYSLESLLPQVDTRPYENGQFAIIFLSPIDCHRVFSPSDGRLTEIIHVPGAPLARPSAVSAPEYPVYTLNERVIIQFSTESGPCALVMVAGWGVGNITFPSADASTGAKEGRNAGRRFSPFGQTWRLGRDV